MKTLSDSDAGQVGLTPTPSTIGALRSVDRPARVVTDARNGQVERSVFRVEAILVEVKREDDRDYHLVIADPDTLNTMIVELVDVTCPGAADSEQWQLMQSARDAFDVACGRPTTSFRKLSGSAVITGVGFFDFLHGQRGVAPNGIELHPVIRFEGTCPRDTG